jgi:hypothetical protein
MAAHLADRMRPWPTPGSVFQGWEQQIAAPFRTFTGHNLRTSPVLKRGLPWNWLRSSTGVEELAANYKRGLTHLNLDELPDRPRPDSSFAPLT